MTGIKRATQNTVLNATNINDITPRSGDGKNFSMHGHHISRVLTEENRRGCSQVAQGYLKLQSSQ